MNVVHRLNGIEFIWDSKKALANLQKHGVALELACQVFFDPFVCLLRTDCGFRAKAATHSDAKAATIPT